MDLFTYLMAKKGQNTGRDLFSYLLGKNAGGSGTYTTFSGISLNISNTVFGKIKNFMLNSTELTQDGTPTPSSPVDVNVIKGDNTITISNSDSSEEQNYNISLASKNLFTTTDNYSFITGYSSYEVTGTNSLSVTSTGDSYDYRYVRFKLNNLIVGQTYYVSANFVNSDGGTTIPLYVRNSADTTNVVAKNTYASGEKISFTATETSAMIRFYASGDTAKINTCTWTNIMVSTSNEDTYEPYYNIEYCEIGNYKDQFFKNEINSEFYDNTLIENEWYLKKNIQKTIINKNTLSDISLNKTTYSQPMLLVAKRNFGRESSWNSGIAKCNSYAEITSAGNVANGKFATNFSQSYISFFNENFEDVTTALNLIDGVIVYIVRTTPTYTQISQENYPTLRGQLEDIYNNSKSYNGQTNITQTNDDLPFNLSMDVKVKEEG